MRTALQLRQGDVLAYVIEDSRVILTKVDVASLVDPFRAFTEWDSDADRRAYSDLSEE